METLWASTEENKQSKFLPYLWGMETQQWNNQHDILYLVFTLPMRNGNFVNDQGKENLKDCFYLTYEEWKPNSMCLALSSSHRFYLTYEEWKLITTL